MGNLCDRDNIHLPVFPLHTKCLMKTKLSYAKLFVKVGQHLLELRCILCLSKMHTQIADSVPNSFIIHFTLSFWVLVPKKHGKTGCLQCIFKLLEIIIKKLFENLKIMQRYLIDTSFDFPHNLTSCTVGIFVICKKVCEIGMPKISLKPMACRQFQKCIHAFKQQAL